MPIELTTTESLAEKVQSRIQLRTAEVGVVGLGRVGLPLAVAFAEAGFSVLGFDIDAEKIKKLKTGQSPVEFISSDRLGALAAAGRFEPTADGRSLEQADAVVVCVP